MTGTSRTHSATKTRPFALEHAYELHPQVQIRPEPFGALLYSFKTRRLSFLKDPTLVTVVRTLGAPPTAAGIVDPARLRQFEQALATLDSTETIRERRS